MSTSLAYKAGTRRTKRAAGIARKAALRNRRRAAVQPEKLTYLSIKDAAKVAGCSQTTMRGWAKEGRFPTRNAIKGKHLEVGLAPYWFTK